MQITEKATEYTTSSPDAYGAVTVTVGDGKAAKRVKQDASPRHQGAPLRWRSLDGQTFDTLGDVADSMRWAL